MNLTGALGGPLTRAPACAAQETEMEETTKRKPRPRGFDLILSEVADGACLREASTALADAAKAVQSAHEARGKASATVTVTLKLSMGKNRVVDVAYDVAAKLPKPVRETGAMWIDKAGNLVPSDPLQLELPKPRELSLEQSVREAVNDAGVGSAKEV